ncbi:glutathione S-transferase N-terminal domain-containing protein [Defluviimonas salinarum]|uniref:Glutathione S-transferase N-terminal domain-containing protein n=1 Tax=Defluviimonas salinarum TaxID=2992147 RepID=A0ABT3J2H7_9RHOB|nr:glutathione S-transferase N-terminal domain-containing protein [Defluviimonas salinarum]MCW3781878.1 glutathione S-transferase N-terminal domain-containing protein [Defluviimonas salinarum]
MTRAVELYYWTTPNGRKITIALEEMGLPYNVTLVNIGKGDQFAPEFLAISPNGRIPAIVDPDGPDGAPVSVFESGAILMYLARKTGRFLGTTAREQIAVEEWLMWQMGGLGPMAGQAHHFLGYAPKFDPPQVLPYAQDRYRREVARLYDVLDRQLGQHEFVAGDFLSIADFAIYPWAARWEFQQQVLDDKPDMRRWFEMMTARPAVQRGMAVAADKRSDLQSDRKAQEILFQQPASPKVRRV